jgi:hypothetical protein
MLDPGKRSHSKVRTDIWSYLFCPFWTASCIQQGTATEKEMNMSGISPALIWEWTLRVLPVVLGAGGGYLFYKFVGCRSGACPITGNPWLSTIYGAILGAMYMVR